jgi:hypothetical protein
VEFFLIRELSQHLLNPGCTVYTLIKLDLKKHGLKMKKDLSAVKEHGPTQQVIGKAVCLVLLDCVL